MKKDDVQISAEVLKLARKMAQKRNCTPNEMISRALQQYKDELKWWQDVQSDMQDYYKRTGKKPPTMDEIVEEVHAYRKEEQQKRSGGS